MTQIDVTTLKTAIGWLRIEAFAGELTRVDLFTKLEPAAESTSTVLQGAVQQLQAYLDDRLQRFLLPLAWRNIEGFRREVLQVVAGIPFGELMSYGEIAKLVGKPGASQAVGAAVGSNPWLIVVPCHRVIGSDRKLHGFSVPGGLETKTWLLRHEGHKIIRGKVSLKGS
jgi:methylated-DNA-[protein]-cysteine S-methyltransferase